MIARIVHDNIIETRRLRDGTWEAFVAKDCDLGGTRYWHKKKRGAVHGLAEVIHTTWKRHHAGKDNGK